MNSSFYNGISGVKTHQFGLDVWADNISNVNNVGFRGNTPEFSNSFSQILTQSYFGSTTDQIGLGSKAQTTALDLSQGELIDTENTFDLALMDEGWFGVQGMDGNVYYTRNGHYNIDANGDMVDDAGNFLMGTYNTTLVPTTLDQETLEAIGYITNNGVQSLGDPFTIALTDDIVLNAVTNQTKITLPDILYLPPEATTYVNYQANLDPEVETQTSYTNITAGNNVVFSNTYPTATISGTFSNNTDISDLKENDLVTLTLTDGNGMIVQIETSLDSSLNFSISGEDISALDNTTTISLSSEMKVVQEIPNVEHFTTEIISPDGEKDIIDMTFTKRVPQQQTGSTWDADIQLLRYYEDYEIQSYNPNLTYDPLQFNVDLNTNTVTKIYDPAIYKVDMGQRKVYEIIDSQTGDASFSSSGQLLSSNIPTLSNSGTALAINIGEPYFAQSVSVSNASLSGSTLTLSGTAPLGTTDDSIQVGDNVAIDITDINGDTITASARVLEDGTWQTTYENYPLDPNFTTNAFVVLNTGFQGMISTVNSDKNRVATKDGYVEGFLKTYGMDTRGNVIAEFDNGRSTPVAKVAVYHFQNDQGLSHITGSLFSSTVDSGDALFYTDANGNPILGTRIISQKLENSNVKLSTAMTELIIMQKAFDASARSITTSDEMIQRAINMKA